MNSSTLKQDPLAVLLAPVTATPSPLRTVLLAGIAAATIDIVFAFEFFGALLGITPVRVLQSVCKLSLAVRYPVSKVYRRSDPA